MIERIVHGVAAALLTTAPGVAPPVVAAAGGCVEYQNFGDLNGDGNADAVIGDPTAPVTGSSSAGMITIVYGRPDDPRPEYTEQLVQGDGVVPGTASAGNQFGRSIQVGYADADVCADVFVGVPGQRVNGIRRAGAVVVLYGSEGGLGRGRPARMWTLATPGVPGDPATGDRFGQAIAVHTGYVHEERPTIAVGAPTKSVNGVDQAGAVFTAQLDVDGDLQSGSVRSFDQTVAGLDDEPEPGDRFGEHLVVTDRGPSFLTVAVGVPNESVGPLREAGAVDEISGLRPGETPLARRWIQDDLDVGDSAERGDRFGASLAYQRDQITAYPHFAVGAPGEDVRHRDDGRVFYFDPQDEGAHQVFDQTLDWLEERPERGDHFGSSVLLLPYRVTTREEILVIGVPGEDVLGAGNAGLVHQIGLSFDSHALVDQSTRGVPGQPGPGDRLGAVLSGFPATYGGRVAGGLMLGLPGDAEYPDGAVLVTRFILVGGDPEDPMYRPMLWRPGAGAFPPGGSRFGETVSGATVVDLPG